jgi:hypothetical protein
MTHTFLVGDKSGDRAGYGSKASLFSCIICFKIKNPPPVELCWQKKEIPRKRLFFFGLAQAPAKI